jgi:hypothetical protein
MRQKVQLKPKSLKSSLLYFTILYNHIPTIHLIACVAGTGLGEREGDGRKEGLGMRSEKGKDRKL